MKSTTVQQCSGQNPFECKEFIGCTDRIFVVLLTVIQETFWVATWYLPQFLTCIQRATQRAVDSKLSNAFPDNLIYSLSTMFDLCIIICTRNPFTFSTEVNNTIFNTTEHILSQQILVKASHAQLQTNYLKLHSNTIKCDFNKRRSVYFKQNV